MRRPSSRKLSLDSLLYLLLVPGCLAGVSEFVETSGVFCVRDADCDEGHFCAVEEGLCRAPEDCQNGLDDDGDQQTDCNDTLDCAASNACGDPGQAETFDFGKVTTSEEISFVIPEGALGFTVILDEGADDNLYAIRSLTRPDGVALINAFASESLEMFASEEAFGFVFPPNDRPDNQVLPGTWKLKIGATQTDSVHLRIVIRRGGFVGGKIPVNVYLPQGLTLCLDNRCNGNGNGSDDNENGNGNGRGVVTAATAANSIEMQGALQTFFVLYQQAEPDFVPGEVRFFDISSSFLDLGSETELGELSIQSSLGGEDALQLFLVQSFSGQDFPNNLGGIASGAPGALTTAGNKNTAIVALATGDPSLQGNLTGRIWAHEAGHFMGLQHTTEFDGKADLVLDTPACDAETISRSQTIADCPDFSNLMFPLISQGAAQLSQGQLLPLRAGPVYR